jgi:hypothetical protein
MENLIKTTLAVMGWEIMNHIGCNPDLAPNNHVCGPMEVHLQGQNLQERYWMSVYIIIILSVTLHGCETPPYTVLLGINYKYPKTMFWGGIFRSERDENR